MFAMRWKKQKNKQKTMTVTNKMKHNGLQAMIVERL